MSASPYEVDLSPIKPAWSGALTESQVLAIKAACRSAGVNKRERTFDPMQPQIGLIPQRVQPSANIVLKAACVVARGRTPTNLHRKLPGGITVREVLDRAGII